MDARIVPYSEASSSQKERRSRIKSYLIDAIGINYGGLRFYLFYNIFLKKNLNAFFSYSLANIFIFISLICC